MEEKHLVICGNQLEARFGITNYNSPYTSKQSKDYLISGSCVFSLKVITAQVNSGHTNVYNNLIFVKLVKLRSEDKVLYSIKLTSNDLTISNKCFTTDDGTWHLIHENKTQQFTFDVSVTMEVVPCFSSFDTLYDDTELTDFELRGEDGSVHVHRAVLAASSPVLRRMLAGTWRETREGHVDIPGTSKTTLQHLKDYIYLRTIPDIQLEQLLLLASYYMMPDLEQKCVYKMVYSLNAENACDLLEFAAKNKVSKLMLAILECVQNGAVNVNDMRDFLQRE